MRGKESLRSEGEECKESREGHSVKMEAVDYESRVSQEVNKPNALSSWLAEWYGLDTGVTHKIPHQAAM